MAWTAPRRWVPGDMATAALLNAQIQGNLLALSTHVHGGSAGDGDDELAGIDVIAMDDIGAAASAGLLRRTGNNLTWGASGFIVTNADPVAATAGLRTLGTGAQQASAGNHTH